MRIILDVSADADNRIEGTASWANGDEPVQFSGWLALMLLLENAQHGRFETGQPASAADPPGDQRVADP
jgi:hypothetical protein